MERTGARRSALSTIAAFYDAFNDDRLDEAVGFLDDGFIWRPAFGRGLLGSNEYAGPDGFRRYRDDLGEVFEDYRTEPVAVEEIAPDVVVVTAHTTARARASGMDVDARFWIVYAIRDGRIVAGQTFRDRDEAAASARAVRPAG